MSKQKFKQGVAAVKGSPKQWDVNYQVKRKRVTKRIEADTYDDALAWRLAKKSALRNTKVGADNGEIAIDLNEALGRLIEKVKNEIDRGARCKTAMSDIVPSYRRFFFDYPKYLGKTWTTIDDFNSEDLEGYKNYYGNVLKKPMGASTEFGKIQNILTHLYQLKIITSLKLFELRQVKRLKKNVRPFIGNPTSDFIKVLMWIKDKKPRLFELLCFLANTGRRPKEVKEYRREFVDLEHNYINIPSKTKDGEPSKLRLDDDLKKIVIRAIDFSRKLNSPYLFLNDQGRKFSANKPQEHFQNAAKECGMSNWDRWCIYQLKKKFITTCRAEGMSAEAISQVTGHKDLGSVLKNY